MFLSWVQAIVEIVKYLWPFRRVDEWERGVLYVWGRWWHRWPARKEDRTLGPGIWPIVPYFMDVMSTTAQIGVVGTPLQGITLTNNKQLAFSAAMTYRIYNVGLGLNRVDKIIETAHELLSAVTAEKLYECDPSRLLESRKRLISDMLKWVNKEMEFMGCIATAIRFTNFIITDQPVHTIRLLADGALLRDFG